MRKKSQNFRNFRALARETTTVAALDRPRPKTPQKWALTGLRPVIWAQTTTRKPIRAFFEESDR